MTQSIGKLIAGSAVAAVVMFSLALSTPASAQQRLHRVENHQSARVRQGVKSGDLTKQEGKALAQHESQIRNEQRIDRANGVTPADRAKIQHQLRQENEAINHLEQRQTPPPSTQPTAAPTPTPPRQ